MALLHGARPWQASAKSSGTEGRNHDQRYTFGRADAQPHHHQRQAAKACARYLSLPIGGVETGARRAPRIVDPSQQQRELVLAALRTVCKRLEQIREEVVLAGVALSTGSIDAQTAIRWSEEIAPGCLPIEVKATFIAKGWDLP